tara:strand:- start:7889 stop:8506 length:618 start_codon:yes stop_codon:yes gene_type:complete
MKDYKEEFDEIAISADPHFGHANIIGLCNRPFQTITEHDNTIVQRHNERVSENALYINLGDLGFRCSPWYISKKIRELNFKKMIVLLGNHDKPLRQAVKKGMLDDLLNDGSLEVVGGRTAIEDQSLITAKMMEIGNQRVIIGHYSYRSWPNAFRNSWHLFGHSHSNLDPYYRSFDVGVDTNDYYPYKWEEIVEKMAKIQEGFSES